MPKRFPYGYRLVAWGRSFQYYQPFWQAQPQALRTPKQQQALEREMMRIYALCRKPGHSV